MHPLWLPETDETMHPAQMSCTPMATSHGTANITAHAWSNNCAREGEIFGMCEIWQFCAEKFAFQCLKNHFGTKFTDGGTTNTDVAVISDGPLVVCCYLKVASGGLQFWSLCGATCAGMCMPNAGSLWDSGNAHGQETSISSVIAAQSSCTLLQPGHDWRTQSKQDKISTVGLSCCNIRLGVANRPK